MHFINIWPSLIEKNFCRSNSYFLVENRKKIRNFQKILFKYFGANYLVMRPVSENQKKIKKKWRDRWRSLSTMLVHCLHGMCTFPNMVINRMITRKSGKLRKKRIDIWVLMSLWIHWLIFNTTGTFYLKQKSTCTMEHNH